jgi:uncharacterized protein (DUF58 family)
LAEKDMKIRWPVIIVLALTLLLALTAGMTMMWRLFIFLVVLLAVSYVWLRLGSRRLAGRLEKAPPVRRVGEDFEETFTVVNEGRLPVFWCEVTENTDLPGYHNRVKFGLPSRGSYTWQSKGVCRRRGQFRVGSLKAKIFDPFGFFYVTVNLADPKYVNVLPAVLDLNAFQVLPRREPGLNTRRWFAGEPGLNASRVREYFSGDSLRHIHWHSTAHTGQLMVKEFDPDMSRSYYFSDVWIVLDMHREATYGTGDENTAEYGIIIASSLVEKYLKNEKKVGFMSIGDRSYVFPPDNDIAHSVRINEALAMIKPQGSVQLPHLLTSQEDRITAGSAVIVITTAGYETLEAPLRRLVGRGFAVTAILLDAVSFGGKVSAADTSRALAASGVNAYVIRRGVEITQALDVKYLATATQSRGAFKR